MRITKSNQKKNEKKNFKKVLQRAKRKIKGITLIALVVTIIILLILAGVALSLTVGDNGLFRRAQNAADTWQMAEQNEQSEMDNISYIIDRQKLKIGDYVEYTPTPKESYNLLSTASGTTNNQEIVQDTSLTWQIININYNDGSVELISSRDTSQMVSLKGALGYNNGVFILNDICKNLYSNSELGINARCINVSDIENKMSAEGLGARDNAKSSANIKYGNTKTYNKDLSYPVLYAQENGSGIGSNEIKQDGIGVNDNFYDEATTDTVQETNMLTVKQTLYSLSDIPESYFKDNTFYNIIFKTEGNFWLASRTHSSAEEYASFGIRLIYHDRMDAHGIYNSDNVTFLRSCALRPIITLTSKIKLDNGDGTLDNPYKISL